MEMCVEFVHREGIFTDMMGSRNNTGESPCQGACTSKSRRASFPLPRAPVPAKATTSTSPNVLASPPAFTQNFTLITRSRNKWSEIVCSGLGIDRYHHAMVSVGIHEIDPARPHIARPTTDRTASSCMAS
jgi:hypothetical protein